MLANTVDYPGAPAHPVIWPAGTTWQADPAAVVLADGQVVELGTEVRGGGGYFPRDGIKESVAPAVADALDSCRGESSEIAVFNAGSDIEVP
ncbi:hypothetical protein FHE66_09340 [Georgenia sp. 311]|uniref:hypothetical protein n=1 Tax=Georgenia sp. 311 TaxID=2585134 RepID=UPI00111252C4|nr:hypothetical protein [Georgenia sp. 311]TNC17637.1 hypothetical protein FHE66_09340 [Georgenia sp. 311]